MYTEDAAVFSVSRAANFTRFVVAIKHAALLCLHTMRTLQVFGDVAYPEFPQDTVRCVTALIRFCSAVRRPVTPTGCVLTPQYGGRMASRGRGVSTIIT